MAPATANRTAKKPYGNVEYADPGYLKDGKKRYPIDAKHVKAAWSYINQERNASQYTAPQLAAIKKRIMGAMRTHGHDVYQATGENAMSKMKAAKAAA